jgi:hypothetical protein
MRSVSVAHQSQIPDLLEASAPNDMIPVMFPIIGSIVTWGARDARATAFRLQLRGERIDPGLILADEFERELQRSHLFPHVGPPADGVFRLRVDSAGVASLEAFGSALKPELSAVIILARKDGTDIWYNSEEITAADGDYPGHSLKEYQTHPELLREAFHKAARLLADKFVDDLKK